MGIARRTLKRSCGHFANAKPKACATCRIMEAAMTSKIKRMDALRALIFETENE